MNIEAMLSDTLKKNSSEDEYVGIRFDTALVMAGGRGSRMKSTSSEKLLLEYQKLPIIFNVIDALETSSQIYHVAAATSPNSPDTKRVLEERGTNTLDTQGNGYANDLNFLLQKMSGYVFVVSGDLPLFDNKIIRKLCRLYLDTSFARTGGYDGRYKWGIRVKNMYETTDNIWTSFLVTKKFLNSLGLESNLLVKYGGVECVYTGISIINADKIKDSSLVKENYIILDDKRIAFNLNTNEDFELLNSS